MQKIIEALINILFLGFGNKLKGYRTIILNVLLGAAMLIEWLSGSVHTFFCDSIQFQCEASFWAIIASVGTSVNIALRYLTNSEVGKTK